MKQESDQYFERLTDVTHVVNDWVVAGSVDLGAECMRNSLLNYDRKCFKDWYHVNNFFLHGK